MLDAGPSTYTYSYINVSSSQLNIYVDITYSPSPILRNYFAFRLVFRTIGFSTTQDISSVCIELETVKYGMDLETFWFRMFTLKPDARKQLINVLNESSNNNRSRTLFEYLNGV
jgi:hypothetical protein